jgi:hypothetical protein
MLKRNLGLGVILLAGVLAMPAGQAGARTRRGRHPVRVSARKCPDYSTPSGLGEYSKVRAFKVPCIQVGRVEAKFAKSLESGSGPSGAVRVDGFACRDDLKLVPNELVGPGSCTASHGRGFTFLFTEHGQ